MPPKIQENLFWREFSDLEKFRAFDAKQKFQRGNTLFRTSYRTLQAYYTKSRENRSSHCRKPIFHIFSLTDNGHSNYGRRYRERSGAPCLEAKRDEQFRPIHVCTISAQEKKRSVTKKVFFI